jgi:hypothetical protein
VTTLVEKVLAVAAALGDHGVPFAFGGALALAYATEEPRGTRDIDVNVFVSPDDVDAVFEALPPLVLHTAADRRAVVRDEQVRLFWDDTPVDLFFAAHRIHHEAAARRRWVDFAGTQIPVLAPVDLAVFKALFDRAKDWVDIETMRDSGTLDTRAAADVVAELLGDDPRVTRLRRM